MKIVVAFGLLVAVVAVVAADGYGYPRQYDYHELAKLEEATHRVAAEKEFLKERLESLVGNNFGLMDKLDTIDNTYIPNINEVTDDQDDRLDALKDKVKAMLHRLGDLEAFLEGEASVAGRQEAQINPLWARIEELTSSNTKQSASLASSMATFEEAAKKVTDTLNGKVEDALFDINEVATNAANFVDLASTRRCTSNVTHVELDAHLASGEQYVFMDASDFSGSIPTVFCAIQGFQTRVNLDESYGYGGYGYGYGYYDDRQSLAVTVDCEAFEDRVHVQVFDQSNGDGNGVDFVYVEVKTCSFGPQAN